MSPSETLSTKPVPSRKKDKSRVTVLLGVNVTGTDKLNPWLIGNSKRPSPLSKVNLNHLPVHYRDNPKAWINSSVFEKVLHLEIKQNDDSDDESFNENQSSRNHGGRMDGSRGRESRMGRSRSRGSCSRGHESRSRRDRSDRHHPDTSRLQLTHVEVVFFTDRIKFHRKAE
ncbi:unnamed protein product [Rhizophagus irregularis]|nr:unnamed protein product [Rhizophagus irregularis]